jgi:hypothetical protein
MLIALGASGSSAQAAGPSAAADTSAAAAMYEALPSAPSPATSADAAAPVDSAAEANADPAAAGDDASGAAADSSTPEAAPLVTTRTVIVPASMPAPSYVKQSGHLPSSTTEIPQSGGAPLPGTAEVDGNPADAETLQYDAQQNPQLIDPQLHSLQEFIDEGDESSSLGIDLREDQRKLNSGEIANGLTIVAVRRGSAAAKVGLRPARRTAHNILEGAAVAAMLVFPPAVIAVPLLEQFNLNDTYDMIIGVDGNRVSNFMDFEDQMRSVQPGEIVYLNIVRNGDRVQVPVHVESISLAPF